jgi:hypothetical protein
MNSINAQIFEIRKLDDGWLNGQGSKPSDAELDWLEEWFENNLDSDISMPLLYPTYKGGVQAEWSFGKFDVSLHIDLDTHKGVYNVLNVESYDDSEITFDMDNVEDSNAVCHLISCLR